MSATTTATALVESWINKNHDLRPNLRRILDEKGDRYLAEFIRSLIIPTAPPRTEYRAWITAALRSVRWARIRAMIALPADGDPA